MVVDIKLFLQRVRSRFFDKKKVKSKMKKEKKKGEERSPEILPATLPLDSNLLDVNLLPVDDTHAPEKTLKNVTHRLILVLLLTLFVVSLLYGALRWFAWSRQQRALALVIEQERIDQALARLEQKADDIRLLEQRISSVRLLLNRHVLWTQFFTQLERYTLPDVYYMTLNVGLGQTISLHGVARDFETLARQLLVLDKAQDFVRVASVANAQAADGQGDGESTIRFTVDLDLNPDIFYFTP